MPSYLDIPQISKSHYQVHLPWDYLERTLDRYNKDYGLELEPDFQRAHVWNKQQQIKYVEFIMRGGKSGKDIYFNCPGWNYRPEGPIQLIDGKQRISAVLRFLKNELPVFGYLYKEWFFRTPDNKRMPIMDYCFIFHIGALNTRAEVLQWYLDLNSGVAHTNKEINRVKKLLIIEESRERLFYR